MPLNNPAHIILEAKRLVESDRRSEIRLNANGGNYQKGADWASFVVTDGKLVTGQNPASSEEAARKLLDLL